MSFRPARASRWLALFAAVAIAGGARAAPPKTPPDSDGDPPAHDALPKLARMLLHDRMERHGDEMAALVRDTTLLRYAAAARLANEIAAEPRIARPSPGHEDDLNARLPERFFQLQDELRDRARAVSVAAGAKDDQKLAQAVGRLAETCVTCHAAYRPRKSGPANDPKELRPWQKP